MASYLQIENISKSYGPKILFENIGFNINEGDKIALIAPNGTGKTSLMRILAGKDKSDSGGKITFLRDIKISFLEQEYDYDPESTIMAQILSGGEKRDTEPEFEYELRVKQLLTSFRLGDGQKKMKELSGGEVKRVAITQMLSGEPDFIIMDEPTNHLDIDAIEYLENFLGRSRCTLLMVTHDRYFLDRVCNIVMEMDRGAVYIYKGNYQNYLEKRDERIANYNAETEKVRNIFRRELEWIHATPCARTGKAKYRINAFQNIKERAEQAYTVKKMDLGGVAAAGTARNATGRLEAVGQRLGSKVIDCKNVNFYYGDECYLKDFSYNFQRGEKVGIVGRNGIGKTTFIDLLVDGYKGIEKGESIKIGYYRQRGMEFDESQTVLETVNDTRLLSMFLFPHDMLSSRVSRLSGGEKRRLYLLTVLMQQPNVLIMDEPTNDLDIVTLNILEEYLKEFSGTLIIVSHDRHFLDRLVDHLFVFCGDGVVKDFIGNFSEYRAFIKDYEASSEKASSTKVATASEKPKTEKPRKLSWKQERELESLEKEIEELAAEKKSLEESLGSLDYQQLQKASERIGEIMRLSAEKEERWLELSC